MKPHEILHALTHASFDDDDPPRKALAAASRQRRRMTPIFLEEIETYLDASPKTQREQPTPIPFIMLLFAEWRETDAYRPLARLLRCSQFSSRFELEDALDVLADPVMRSTFDGDPVPLYELALDPDASMHTRAVVMTDTICALTIAGRIDKESAADFLITHSSNSARPRRASGTDGRTSLPISSSAYCGHWSSGPSKPTASTTHCSTITIWQRSMK
ncbi:hypothetical protein [Methylocystis sp.]|uniref:hypothetical protein n=1 Tax=Methylocystis sp. TaxID=1911079 RepID=UPI0025D41CA4|nr:hypothetical protein [Methylocystis sp.]